MSRVALVIGNEAYKRLGKLATPKNDVSAIATKLRGLNFVVDEQVDVDRDKFTDAVMRFQDRMVGAETSLFFFAGHGFQFNEQNYLAPVDIDGERGSDLSWRAIEVKKILDVMSSFPQTSLVFLDACRESVVFRRWIERARTASQTRDMRLTFGFAPMDSIKRLSNTYIAFSTEPGGVAIDSVDGRHSPFVNALLSNIDEPGLSISDLMIRVRRDVLRSKDQRQVPWDESSLLNSFHFNPGDAIEKYYFTAVVRTPLDADRFLAKYPNSRFHDDVVRILKDYLADIEDVAKAEACLKEMHTEKCVRIASARLAELCWKPLRQSKDIASVAAFVERFPDFGDARERIADLHLMKIERNADIEGLNKFIDKFRGTVAAKTAERVRHKLRQNVFAEYVRNETRPGWLKTASLPDGVRLPVLAIVSDICLISSLQFSDLATTLLSGAVALMLAANKLLRTGPAKDFEAVCRFFALALTLLIFLPALFQYLDLEIFGVASFQSAIRLWAVVISSVGIAGFVRRVKSSSLFLIVVYGITIGIALSLTSEWLMHTGIYLLLIVGLPLAFWLARLRAQNGHAQR